MSKARIMLRFLAIAVPALVEGSIFGEQLNSYSIFHTKHLSLGKNVTVGKFVLSYMTPAERVKIMGTSPSQFFEIKLKWINKDQRPTEVITGRWIEADRKFYIGIGRKQGRHKPPKENPLIPSRSSKHPRDTTYQADPTRGKRNPGLIFITNTEYNLISVPLKPSSYLYIYPDKSLADMVGTVRIVISSNYAYQITR